MSSTGSSSVTPGDRDPYPASGADRGATADGGGLTHRDGSFRDVVSRQKEEFGGIKFGSAFFGWLTATGTSVILLALVAGVAAAVGANNGLTPQTATENAQRIGIWGGIIVAAVLFIAYYCGGYVAGRMARFNGLKQGLAVWLWAVIIILLLTIVGAIVGSSSDVVRQVSFPQVPTSQSELTASGIIALAVLLVAALVGALLGGLAGMRFHRKVDKASYGQPL
jgi:amino acid transporter